VSNFWQNKLAPVVQQPAAPPPGPAFRYQPPQQNMPPTGPPQRAPQPPQSPESDEYDPEVPEGHTRFGTAMRKWRGGPAHKEGAVIGDCPECGSRLYSQRAHGSGARVRGNPPAPHCFECGYNGLFELGVPQVAE
jgi:hypothetical protein